MYRKPLEQHTPCVLALAVIQYYSLGGGNLSGKGVRKNFAYLGKTEPIRTEYKMNGVYKG